MKLEVSQPDDLTLEHTTCPRCGMDISYPSMNRDLVGRNIAFNAGYEQAIAEVLDGLEGKLTQPNKEVDK